MHFDFTIRDFKVGERVELHPATDRWMRGDRYGTIEKIGRRHFYVRMDRSGHLAKIDPSNIGDLS